jgi:hypothetical protein
MHAYMDGMLICEGKISEFSSGMCKSRIYEIQVRKGLFNLKYCTINGYEPLEVVRALLFSQLKQSLPHNFQK